MKGLPAGIVEETVVSLPHKFDPRDYQKALMRAIVQENKRYGIQVWHRRAGKDKTDLNIMAMMASKTKGNYAYLFPHKTLGRRALWRNIDARSGMRVIDHLPKALVGKTNESEMLIELRNGSTIQILGTKDLDVVGGNPIGVIFSESAQHRPDAWPLISPILRENGGWILFNGTPRGRNWFYRLYETNLTNPTWHVERLGILETGVLTGQDMDEERRQGISEATIRQEFYCDFNAANAGAIWGDLLEKARKEGRIVNGSLWDPAFPVHTAWDLGGSANTATWYFQLIGGEIRLIDFDFGLKLETPARWARMVAKGYAYGTHILPHDADAKKVGEASWRGDLIKAGMPAASIRVLQRIPELTVGLGYVRKRLPLCRFAVPACSIGLEALESYQWRKLPADKVGHGADFQDEPEHSWASHPADAFRYIAEAMEKGVVKDVIFRPPPSSHNHSHSQGIPLL